MQAEAMNCQCFTEVGGFTKYDLAVALVYVTHWCMKLDVPQCVSSPAVLKIKTWCINECLGCMGINAFFFNSHF